MVYVMLFAVNIECAEAHRLLLNMQSGYSTAGSGGSKVLNKPIMSSDYVF